MDEVAIVMSPADPLRNGQGQEGKCHLPQLHEVQL